MRAVDTNIVVRYLTGDDPKQADKARALIGSEPVFIPRTVMLETEWVLRGVYELPPGQIIPALRALAGLRGVSVEDAALVATAMDWAEAGMDFADALHLAAAAECEAFITFDKRFARSAARSGGVPVTAP
ncbi:type II toxin-antitoxin system VapC family toxin [Acidisphaera sp. L21]|uniref:type II toxin-antitoxin system VapC family toxin n=1 Tax=Acidisphaera sp. L21 TaxID=1641851 RepID=UPI00131BDBB9|nr:type II toxin-antitoxin system VapC family toxin [Acidisphaera sp. L21]